MRRDLRLLLLHALPLRARVLLPHLRLQEALEVGPWLLGPPIGLPILQALLDAATQLVMPQGLWIVTAGELLPADLPWLRLHHLVLHTAASQGLWPCLVSALHLGGTAGCLGASPAAGLAG